MKVIIIDDELPAIERLSHLLKKDGRFEIANTFTDAVNAIEFIKNNNVNIVFSDIEMPSMDGISFGSRLREISPKTVLVYITAYSDYALDAYNNFAMGYLLKPIASSQLSALLNKIYMHIPAALNSKKTLTVNTLGNFSLNYGDTAIKFRTKKAKELFCFLLHHDNSWVKADSIMYYLWQDKTIDLAKTHLHTSLSYCRKAFKDVGLNNIIEHELGTYRINSSDFIWDYKILKNKISNFDNVNIQKDKLLEIFHLDKGMYMSDSDYSWSQETRSLLDIELHNLFSAQIDNPNLSDDDKQKLIQYINLKHNTE